MGDENDVDRIKERAQQDAADHYEANKFSCLAIREMVYQDRERLIELYEQQKQQLATVTEQRGRAWAALRHVDKNGADAVFYEAFYQSIAEARENDK